MKHQIFISYRRNGGEAMAQLLHDKLVSRGFKVFYDIESLKSGPFDKKLYQKIEECDDFILVLPPQALDRCIYDEDWVRCEIRHALSLSKNIIPIMMRGFVFPSMLPDDIQAVSKMNGVEFETMEYLNARIDKIVSMLKSNAGTPVDPSRPAIIRNVCSFGSCDFKNTNPSDAFYSEVIDRDKYNVIYFPMSVTPIKDKTEITSRMTIYDSNNNIALDNTSTFDWAPNFNQLTRSWIIKGENGSFVNAGVYRVVFQIDNSIEYEYKFKVFSQSSETISENGSKNSNEINNSKETLKNPTRNLACPKALLLHFMTSIAMVIMFAFVAREAILGSLIFLAVTVAAWILLFRYTKTHITPNLLLCILITTLVYWYYGAYLAIMSILYIFKHKEWENQVTA